MTEIPAIPSSAHYSSGDTPATEQYRFAFTGDGQEFFRIWIVNVALTIVTLGIYSAWAKVRTRRYLYGNTSVADGHFDYHADPKVILRGRIIAVALLGLYLLLTSFFAPLTFVFILLIIIALPWIVIRAMAFNARNTSWRNLRFNFIGEAPQAFGAYVGWNIVGLLTMGLGMPYAWYKAAEFGVNNHRLGRTPFQLRATARDFYAILVALILAGIAAGFAMLLIMSMLSAIGSPALIIAVQVPVTIVLYALYFNLFNALRLQTIYVDLGLGENNITSNMSVMGYLRIAVRNTFAMLFTLGLYYPWAKVNITRYIVESLRVEAADLDSFVASSQEENSAFGEEFGEAFDLGIGV